MEKVQSDHRIAYFPSGNRPPVTILDLPQDYSNDDNIAYSPLYNVIVNVLSV